MKKLVMLGLAGLLIFGASAATSWFVFQPPAAGDETEQETASGSTNSNTTPVANANPTGDPEQLAFQPDDISIETLLRLVSSIKSREEALDTRQNLISQREERLDLVLSDVEREQKEIQELNVSVESNMKRLDEYVQAINNAPQNQGSDETGDGAGAENPQDALDPKNIPRIAAWLKNLPPADAADTVRMWVNKGEKDLVAQIFLKIDERDASNILGALNEPSLIATIAESVIKAKAKAKPNN